MKMKTKEELKVLKKKAEELSEFFRGTKNGDVVTILSMYIGVFISRVPKKIRMDVLADIFAVSLQLSDKINESKERN